MFEIDLRPECRDLMGDLMPQDILAAENANLRLLLGQAEINAHELLTQAGIDAKERAASDRLQKLILEELHHRIKNTLSTVGAIASQSLRNVPGAGHARDAIQGRLLALSRAHDLLLQTRWTSADLKKTVRVATEAFDNQDAPKFSIDGPAIEITSGAVIAMAMTLNELGTNTTKFGALSVEEGRVDIRWAIDEPTLRLTWCEKDGPTVQAPTTQSFGTRLVETLDRQLKGEVRLSYEPSGFLFALDVPLASLTPSANPNRIEG
jgi:two-component sensor histidine kinase